MKRSASEEALNMRDRSLDFSRMLKNAHQSRAARDSPHPSSLQRTYKYASLLRISGALHLGIFEHPGKNYFFRRLLGTK
jgi:hypothetical protein